MIAIGLPYGRSLATSATPSPPHRHPIATPSPPIFATPVRARAVNCGISVLARDVLRV
jgi:hypothetical protein